MRIPVKSQYKGYRPLLDLSSRKLIWIKSNGIEIGIPGVFIGGVLSLSLLLGVRWAYGISSFAGDYDKTNVYRDLGHGIFISIFTVALFLSIVLYIYALFMYNSKKIRKISSKESITLYKKADRLSEGDFYPKIKSQTNIKLKQIFAVLTIIFFTITGFVFLTIDNESTFTSGALLGALFTMTLYMPYVLLYYSSTYFARRYLDKKLNIKSKK